MKNLLFLFVFLFAAAQTAFSQDFSLGFQAGLNYSTFKGRLEADPGGNFPEEMVTTSGFMIGATANYKLLDVLGLRGELVFSQLGGRYRYNGWSVLFFPADSGEKILAWGDKNLTLNISNAYFYLPLSVTLRPIKQIELSAGAGAGFLISSTAVGQLRFNGITEGGQAIDSFELSLAYNYLRDQTGDATGNKETLLLDGEAVSIPQKAGAYWEAPRLEQGTFFNRFDFSLHAALSFYFGKSLFVGGKIQYGLTDVTNNAYDFSAYGLDAQNERIPREDKDIQISYQLRVGFNF